MTLQQLDVEQTGYVLLDHYRYYLHGLPYASLSRLLKEAVRMGLKVTPLSRMEKKRKIQMRKQIEFAFFLNVGFCPDTNKIPNYAPTTRVRNSWSFRVDFCRCY